MEVGWRGILDPSSLWHGWCKASIWVAMLVLWNLLANGEVQHTCLLHRCILRVGESHCHVFLGGLDPGQAPLKTLLLILRLT